MFFPWVFLLLAAQGCKSPADAAAGRSGLDNFVYKTSLGGDKWIGEAVFVILRMLRDLFCIPQICTVNNFGCSLGAHHRDFSGWPSIIKISAQML